jgi:multidrug resistance efflux pump
VAEAQVEQVQANLSLLKAGPSAEEISVAQSRVDQAQRALEGAQIALEKTILRAPFAGTIGRLAVEEGEVVTTVGNVVPVAIIGDLRRLRVETDDLSEVDIAQIEIDQRVEIEVDALPDTELHGRVVEIAPMATVQHGDTVYTVAIDLEEGLKVGLRWGMTAYVDIIVEEEEGS